MEVMRAGEEGGGGGGERVSWRGCVGINIIISDAQ